MIRNFALFSITALAFFALSATGPQAAPFNAADNNPNVVAFYDSGTHGIVGESATHTSTDLVMGAGKSGNFQQWFWGTAGGVKDGDHSLWKNVGSKTSCPKGWDLVKNASLSWGSYLAAGANYCVRTNDFRSNSGGDNH